MLHHILFVLSIYILKRQIYHRYICHIIHYIYMHVYIYIRNKNKYITFRMCRIYSEITRVIIHFL